MRELKHEGLTTLEEENVVILTQKVIAHDSCVR
jgi:hypothetical protein